MARGDVFVVGTRDGGEATRLTATPDLESEPSWFPDSRRVVYASMRGTAWNLFVQDAVHARERALTSGAARSYGARVSPDGKWVAYQRDGGEIRVCPPTAPVTARRAGRCRGAAVCRRLRRHLVARLQVDRV
ncbi:MAG: PD40 domain-containing protein [Gemmatimonadaceae bacterium]|nr:PD40 domain-containing protein [Gemmatimonadaceae bacterium]